MVDTRYMNRGTGFFCDKFDNMYTNDFLYKKATYFFKKEFSEFLITQLLIKPNLADCLAGTILARMDNKDNTVHNALYVLSSLDFTRKYNILLTDSEKLTLWTHLCIHDDNTTHYYTSIMESAYLMRQLLLGYVQDVNKKQIIEDSYAFLLNLGTGVKLNITPQLQKMCDLLNWSFASTFYSYKNIMEFTAKKSYTHNSVYWRDRNEQIDNVLRAGNMFKSIEMSRFNKTFENNELKLRKIHTGL